MTPVCLCQSQNKVIPRFPQLKLQPCLFMQRPSAALSRLKYGTKLQKPTRKCLIPQRGCCSLQPAHPENCRKLRVCLWKLDIRVGASLILLSVQYFVCQEHSQECAEAHSHHCDGAKPISLYVIITSSFFFFQKFVLNISYCGLVVPK